MKKINELFFLTALFLFFFGNSGYAQDSSSTSSKDYANSPLWIQMMNDPNTNYYEALKAFDEYWKFHDKPVLEEEEESGNGENDFSEMKREIKKEQKKDKSVVLTEEQWKEKNDYEDMKYNVKLFERWEEDVKPFVQEDGRILTDEEIRNIWQIQQEEIKNQKK